MTGWSTGRPLAAKILRTAAGFVALAPSPYTVSVGNATSSPSRSACTAVSISTWVALTTRTMASNSTSRRYAGTVSWGLGRDGHRKFLQSQGGAAFRVVSRHHIDVASGRQGPVDETGDTAAAELIRFQDAVEWRKPRARALVIIPRLQH